MPTTITMTGPGSATIVDDAGILISTAITAQTTQQKLDTERMIELMAYQLYALNRIADSQEKIAKSLSDINIAVGTVSSAASANNALQSLNIASQIQANNFQLQVTREALARADLPQPTLPPLSDQVKTIVKESSEMNAIAAANGAISQAVQTTISNTAAWIAGTEIYQTVERWVKSAKDTLLAPLLPSKATATTDAEAAVISGTVPPVA